MLLFFPCWGMITSLQLSLTVLWWVYATVHEWLMYCSSRQLLSLPHSSYRGHWFAISPGVMLHTQVSLFTTRYSIFCVPCTSIVVESHCVAPGSKSACIKYSASVALSTSTVFLWTAVFISMQAEWRSGGVCLLSLLLLPLREVRRRFYQTLTGKTDGFE